MYPPKKKEEEKDDYAKKKKRGGGERVGKKERKEEEDEGKNLSPSTHSHLRSMSYLVVLVDPASSGVQKSPTLCRTGSLAGQTKSSPS